MQNPIANKYMLVKQAPCKQNSFLLVKLFCLLLVILSLGLIHGCKSLSAEDPIVAVISTQTEKSLSELRTTIREALNGTPVTIAKTAFNNSNRLILERKKIRAPDGTVIDTRVDQQPYIFELYIIDGNCYLNYLKKNKKYLLKETKCIKKRN